jgi:integrase
MRAVYVFPSDRTKGPLRGDAVTKALQRICRRLIPKIEGLGPHDIRRTIGTSMRKLASQLKTEVTFSIT